ncbi:hypothetical protein WJX73_009548 [Symbiochloris irregularis]|uniref:Elongator complex protein 2 n=1 Tax=Symbiochloris irregularis TaxID=706552 RepID=A0AAW1P0S1_9CHLO
MRVVNAFRAAGCNRVCSCLDWGPDDRLAYGSSSGVVIYNVQSVRVEEVLQGHTDRVNCTLWLRTAGLASSTGRCQALVSGAADCTVLVWLLQPTPSSPWCQIASLKAHESPVSAVSCVWESQTSLVLVSVADDKHAAALTCIPGHDRAWIMLALGGVDNAIRLFVRPAEGNFQAACKLKGHADWIRSLAFTSAESSSQGQKTLLASASQDRYVRIWALSMAAAHQEQHAEGRQLHSERLASHGEASTSSLARYAPRQQFSLATGLWLSEESMGDAGAQNLGYYTCAWSPDCTAVVAHGYTGALHLWTRSAAGGWVARQALGGHYASVVDLAWGLGDTCLFTASEDQTARVFAKFSGRWCEIARPQVHGHDFSCLAYLPPEQADGRAPPLQGGWGRVLYASGSEEKVLRVLEAPQAFLDTLDLAQGVASPAGQAPSNPGGAGERALGAAVAALGLSNKAIYASRAAEDSNSMQSRSVGPAAYGEGPDLAPCAAPSATAEPPLEEHLAQSTLWPEIIKLYGHGNDLFCVAGDTKGRYLASACKSQSAEFARIWLWDVHDWTPAGQLHAHTLTVTQLRFSPDGAFLLSASRDRSFALFQRSSTPGAEAPFELVTRVQKAHTRIIWAVAWAPDSCHFATGSRDGTVKLWSAAQLGTTGSAVKPLGTLLAELN